VRSIGEWILKITRYLLLLLLPRLNEMGGDTSKEVEDHESQLTCLSDLAWRSRQHLAHAWLSYHNEGPS
jgi:hypothetical protein